jgi:hypothetical protein
MKGAVQGRINPDPPLTYTYDVYTMHAHDYVMPKIGQEVVFILMSVGTISGNTA